MKEEWIERIYAGWLGKIIGIRLGAPVEGWTYREIENMFGEIRGYPADYRNFAADDDSNGPLFFLRAMDDASDMRTITPQDVAEALLNYAPYEHGFFWWGGYGVSTEHTAYLNLRNGIPAPRSGSIAQNGKTVAEQIGGQIFIDTWGLAAAGDPDRAAAYARAAASVTHDGNGIYGGIFIAVCVSLAFVETDLGIILDRALTYIPADCEYARAVHAVIDFHAVHPDDWRTCFRYVQENFGYDRYPGNCHIIPNAAVVILSLLYGGGDFSRTLCIAVMCGWDTDCNAGNAGAILGVLTGLPGIDAERWRRPVNDLLICSGVMGSMNIQDIPSSAGHMARLAFAAAGQEVPGNWRKIMEEKEGICHFEFPGSTHAIRVRTDSRSGDNRQPEMTAVNTDEAAFTGKRSLKVTAEPLDAGTRLYIYKQTCYRPDDFNDSRYDPSFSPLVYPGENVHISVMLPEYCRTEAMAAVYVHDRHSGRICHAETVRLEKGRWAELSFRIPQLSGVLLDEAGVFLEIMGPDACFTAKELPVACFIDDLYSDGQPDYTLDASKETEEQWNVQHVEVSQFSRLKGLLRLEDGRIHLSCADFGECYTGSWKWRDYTAVFDIVPETGEWHMVNFRVQGAERSYAAGLLPDGRFALLKNESGYRILEQTDFAWKAGEKYRIRCSAAGSRIDVSVGDRHLSFTDPVRPYLYGAAGLSVRQGSHLSCMSITVS